ncbi:LPS export ABC transporter periplasmic protein LptC [Chelativorans sp.]|uniref:LPS export ABC transporter periplasmic protein LptC n=1 Tax=Chelativorans sp. TaxID=2203393 RepID=UPI002811B5C5|nr:LPS export ABC transporter periplasmic protein LptC [Chelativorans sp.]
MNSAVNARSSGLAAPSLGRSERGAEAFEHARRHSRRVRALKIVLPAAAVVIGAVFLGYSFLAPTGFDSIDLDSTSIENGNLVMHNPSLNGFTGENLPFHVMAARARQLIGSDAAPIELDEISATLPLDKDRKATVHAGGGVLDRENNHLRLTGTVTFETNFGMYGRLESADVDIASSTLSSDQPVEMKVNGMQVRANNFSATEGGRKIVFEDRVRIEIDPAELRRAQAEGNAADG